MRLAVLSDIHGNLPALDFITLARWMAEEAGYKDLEYIPDDIWELAAVKYGIGVL